MSKLIVSQLQNGSGPIITLPTATPVAGQFITVDGTNKITFRDLNRVTTNIPTTATVASPGDMWIISSTGEVYYCTAVQLSPYKSYWLSSFGNAVGYPQGQQLFAGTIADQSTSNSQASYSFTVPAGVESISAVLVGAGGGGSTSWSGAAGGGGALAWANDIPVTPGETLTVRLQAGNTPQGTNGQPTELLRGSTVLFSAEGGKFSATTFAQIAKPVAGTITPGNVNSGRGGLTSINGYGGGGGAGGYSGNGGNGSYGNTNNSNNSLKPNSPNGDGGAAGGGGGYESSTYSFAGGGGVGLFGEGSSGSGYIGNSGNQFYTNDTYTGKGGSGGENGMDNSGNNTTSKTNTFGSAYEGMITTTGGGTPTGTRIRTYGQGGLFGGGGAGGGTSNPGYTYGCTGGAGGARIIWGIGRRFPNTNTGNVTTVNY